MLVIRFVFMLSLLNGITALDIKNNLMKTRNNNLFYGFRGIKYAEAPIADLRFKVCH